MPSAAKYLNNAPPKSVVPGSPIRMEVPRGIPAWPAINASRDDVPVDVVGCPVSGEGRTPGMGAVGTGRFDDIFSGIDVGVVPWWEPGGISVGLVVLVATLEDGVLAGGGPREGVMEMFFLRKDIGYFLFRIEWWIGSRLDERCSSRESIWWGSKLHTKCSSGASMQLVHSLHKDKIIERR
ncbi:hypothetical protein BDZ91DRAFT_714670 [Kalaharituber pfeilii]|nr:hypothetical protein BDZ91DRAFT_714670 [Kalaharituber pfeilii]